MSFAKTTAVLLLSGVPLDNSYSDTITFGSLDNQEAYFKSKMVKQAMNLTYQREASILDYPIMVDDIVNVNYLMFKNESVSNKWYYAFVVGKEYVSEMCTRVYFEIDAYQTFMFDVDIKECFVEREHVNNDAVGANLIDEGFACGEYVTNGSTFISFDDWCVVVASTVDLEDPDFKPLFGTYNPKIFSGCAYYGFSSDGDIMGLNLILNNLATAGKLDSIVQVFMFPTAMLPIKAPHFERLDLIMTPRTDVANIPKTGVLNGYTPKNNKLLTSPYKSGVVSVTTGGSLELPYEYFTGSPEIMYGAMIIPNGGILLWARNFKGVVDNYGYMLNITDFPSCTWLGNSYANWNAVQTIRSNYDLQNNTVGHAMGVATNAVNNLSSGNVGGAIGSAVNSVADYALSIYNIASNLQEEREVHSLVPMVARGQTSCSPLIACSAYGILLEDRSITSDYARTIDEFWNVFGYKVNKVKKPNITGRKSWNYVKCSGAKVVGRCATQYIDIIKGMLNKGVTFWHGDYVGNYSLDNSIL